MSAAASATVTIKLERMRRLQSALVKEATAPGWSTPLGVAMKQIAVRYRSFLRLRFARLSRGGGEWPPLAPSTIKARRKGKGKGKPAILRDVGLLYNALSPTLNSPGAINERVPFGVRVGYGGPMRHGEGRATIADIASYHQRGVGRLPQRKIIVPPDGSTRRGMMSDARRALKKITDGG